MAVNSIHGSPTPTTEKFSKGGIYFFFPLSSYEENKNSENGKDLRQYIRHKIILARYHLSRKLKKQTLKIQLIFLVTLGPLPAPHKRKPKVAQNIHSNKNVNTKQRANSKVLLLARMKSHSIKPFSSNIHLPFVILPIRDLLNSSSLYQQIYKFPAEGVIHYIIIFFPL